MKYAREQGQSLHRLLQDGGLLMLDASKGLSDPVQCIIWLNLAKYKTERGLEIIKGLMEAENE